VGKPKMVRKHAIKRMNQRGIHREDLDLVLNHGKQEYAPGSAIRYVLSEKRVRGLRRALDRMEHGAIAIVQNGRVTTVYKKYK